MDARDPAVPALEEKAVEDARTKVQQRCGWRTLQPHAVFRSIDVVAAAAAKTVAGDTSAMPRSCVPRGDQLQKIVPHSVTCLDTCRYTAALDAQGIVHNLHLFVDTENAPASAIFQSINGVCEKVTADVLVMAVNNKVRNMLDRS